MAVKGAKTINEYRILKWVDDNFQPGSVQVDFKDPVTAVLTDLQNNSMTVRITSNNEIEVE